METTPTAAHLARTDKSWSGTRRFVRAFAVGTVILGVVVTIAETIGLAVAPSCDPGTEPLIDLSSVAPWIEGFFTAMAFALYKGVTWTKRPTGLNQLGIPLALLLLVGIALVLMYAMPWALAAATYNGPSSIDCGGW